MSEHSNETDQPKRQMPAPAEVERIWAAKKEWHKEQANLPIREKFRIMLQMQRDDYPILKARGVLRYWEKPWDIEA